MGPLFHELKTKLERNDYRCGYAAGLAGESLWSRDLQKERRVNAWRNGYLEGTLTRLRTTEMRLSALSRRRPRNSVPRPLEGLAGTIHELTECSGPAIYFLLKGGQVLYVGQSINPLVRLAVHAQRGIYDQVLYLPTAREKLNEMERYFIALLRPSLNKTAGTYGRPAPSGPLP